MQIVNIKVKELKPYAKNAKKHPQEQIDRVAKSIELTKGLKQPIVIDSNKCIVVGHGRVLACKQLGIDEVPCVYCEGMTDEEIKAYRLADNKTNESDWDFDLLEDSLDEIFDIDMSAFGFDLELDEPQDIIEDEAPEVDEENEPTAKLGDIWQLGRHRLMCGDSTDKECVEKLMNGVKADLLLTDPPYGIDYGGMLKGKGDGNGGSDKNGWKSYNSPEWDKERPDCKFFEIGKAKTKNQIIWGGNYFTDIFPPTMCWLIWDKGQREFSLADGEMAWTSFNNAMRIKEYSRALANRENKVHPTQKPIEIMKWCFEIAERYGKKEQETVLDIFGGSGSTLIACEQLDRTCFMMELDPKYVDVIIKRWENLTGKTAIKEQ